MNKAGRLSRKTYFRDSRSAVVVVRQKSQSPMPLHRHEFLEIAVVLSGHGIYTTPRRPREIRSGDVMVVNSSHSHGYENTRSLELANVLVREDTLQSLENELGRLPGYHALFTLERLRRHAAGEGGHVHLNASALGQVESWISAIESETDRMDEGGAVLARAWLVVLIGSLSRSYGEQAGGAARLDMRMGRVLSAIDLHPEGEFRLTSMAAAAAMSERSFLRHFKEVTSCSPTDYVLRARVRKAIRLMEERGARRSITEIAFACGFNDSNYFSRQFRRIAGQSPRDHLKKQTFQSASSRHGDRLSRLSPAEKPA